MIDLRAARGDPDRFRAALARKGAGEAFDALLATDARWREIVQRVEELRARQKLSGRPTPAEAEALKRVKAELRRGEEELAAAEAARDVALREVPNPPHESVPDGASAAKKYDIEAWFPGQGRYREVTSCSNTTDFQARRLGIRTRGPRGLEPVHTLNGTAAADRTMLALLENGQRPDGSVEAPVVLRAFGAPAEIRAGE